MKPGQLQNKRFKRAQITLEFVIAFLVILGLFLGGLVIWRNVNMSAGGGGGGPGAGSGGGGGPGGGSTTPPNLTDPGNLTDYERNATEEQQRQEEERRRQEAIRDEAERSDEIIHQDGHGFSRGDLVGRDEETGDYYYIPDDAPAEELAKAVGRVNIVLDDDSFGIIYVEPPAPPPV